MWRLDRPGALLQLLGELMMRLHERPLAPREKEILYWFAQGKTDRETASILGISPKTVETYSVHIYLKLDVHNRAQAVAEGFRKGIL